MKTDLDPDDPVVRTAVKGKVVEDFLTSDVGKILIEYAKRSVDKSTEELKIVSPLRIFKVMKLQHHIEVWEGFQQALADAIMDGLNAMKIIEGDE
jgi:hypothetical protein